MLLSGLKRGRSGRIGAALLVLGAAAVLAACKHNMKTADTKGLWIANGNDVVEFVPGQLMGGVQNVAPHRTISSGALGTPQGVTFDSAGNLWVMDPGAMVNGQATPALLKFSSAQLAALGMTNGPEPAAIITSTSLAFPQQSVFDAQGNQWVSDHNNNTILVFTAAQLAMTGTNNLMPAVVITSAAFNGPLGIVFDGAGNLWVANNGEVPGNNNTMSPVGTSIVEFAKANLPAVPTTGMLTPDLTPSITLTDNGQGSIQGPWELAFDAMGNLWSSNAATPFTLVAFGKASLGASGTPAPMTTISPTMDMGVSTLNSTNGLCFDNAGDIAATNAVDAGSAPFYTAPLKSGAITPQTFFSGTKTTLTAPAGCNFGPLVN
jgi:secreted PhoX family phosphatase